MNDKFLPAEISRQTKVLEARFKELLRASKVEAITKIQPYRVYGDDHQLTVAFVGNHNAGKSTILSALTGRNDIPIEASVCTDEVTGYRWHDLLLLDTPGVQAGYPDHDEKTEKAVCDSDLLIFVITAELFSDVSAPYFQKLVFERGKADQTLLVVNKMSLDGGSAEIKKRHIDVVCRPKNSVDFGTTFIDTQSYLDSENCKNEKSRLEFIALSNFHSFIEMLNEFAKTKCNLGKLTSPIQRIRDLGSQAAALASVNSPEEAATVEYIGRLADCLSKSKIRLRERLTAPIQDVTGKIRACGHDLADEIIAGSTEEDLKKKDAEVTRRAEKATNSLGGSASEIIDSEMLLLDAEINAIKQSYLGIHVQNLLGLRETTTGNNPTPDSEWEEIPINRSSDSVKRLQGAYQTAQGARQVGKFLSTVAEGPGAAGAGGLLRAGQVAGGSLHQAVYEAGKFFGMNFKPWQAVNAAKVLGNVGRIISVAGAALIVILEVVQEIQERKEQAKLLECRNEIRSSFCDAAAKIERNFWDTFDEFAEARYDIEIDALNDFKNEIVKSQVERRDEVSEFETISNQAVDLLNRIN